MTAELETAITEHVQEASRVAMAAFPRTRARAYRRAIARGYWHAATVTLNTFAGIQRSALRLHIDAEAFVRRVDIASHAGLSATAAEQLPAVVEQHYYADGTPAHIGDAVVCVNDASSFGRLAVGGLYAVEPAYDGTPVVIARGAYHSTDRFKRA